MLRFCLALLTITAAFQAQAQSGAAPCEIPPDLGVRLQQVPAELTLYDGRLRIVNVYKRQAEILLDAGLDDAEAARRWVSEVYPAHREFWAGYVGDEQAFTELAKGLMPYRKTLLCNHIPKLLALDLNAQFTRHATWLEHATGRSPIGTWYLAYGSGATDMGGLGSIGMLIDFSNQQADAKAIDNLLPHELAHQVHGQRRDPGGDTVLGRIVSEGLATYVACVRGEGRFTPADCIGYSEEEWRWAVAHETQLRAFAKPLLNSRVRADSDAVASRTSHPLEGSPGAVGYFLGHRIVGAYVARHGEDSWKALLDMPVRRVLRKSGYRL